MRGKGEEGSRKGLKMWTDVDAKRGDVLDKTYGCPQKNIYKYKEPCPQGLL